MDTLTVDICSLNHREGIKTGASWLIPQKLAVNVTH